MNIKLKWSIRILFSLFALFGIIMISIIIHEYSHVYDFKNIDKQDEEICGLVLPKSLSFNEIADGKAGYYTFRATNQSQNLERSQIRQYTEKRAYTISTAAFFIFALTFFFVLHGWLVERENNR